MEPQIPGLPPVAAPGRLSNEQLVFGADFKRDSEGHPIEQGHGARGHETPQHLNALERTKKLLDVGADDREGLKKLLQDLLQPPEDMTDAQKAAKQARDDQEKAQEDRIAGLEQQIADLKEIMVGWRDRKVDAAPVAETAKIADPVF